MSATELVCAAPSQQRLRRSSVAAALRAASAPSQLRRGRDAQNERDGAGLCSSVAAATPSQLRRCASCHTIIKYHYLMLLNIMTSISNMSMCHPTSRSGNFTNERADGCHSSHYKTNSLTISLIIRLELVVRTTIGLVVLTIGLIRT